MDRINEFNRFCNIIDTLLGEDGCPWDKAQTHKSLTQHLLEECHEVIDAVNQDDTEGTCEELGDVMLMIVMYSKIAEQKGLFTVADVLNHISNKMINRHPHIFHGEKVTTSDEVIENWEKIKVKEKGFKNNTDILKSVPRSMPALMRAQKVQKKAQKLDLNNESGLEFTRNDIEKLYGCLGCFEGGFDANLANQEDLMILIGELIFKIVTISIKFQINPEFALTNEVERFINRFEQYEKSSEKK